MRTKSRRQRYLAQNNCNPLREAKLLRLRSLNCCCLFLDHHHNTRIFIIPIESNQDGWRRLEYEEILASAPVEEPGAGLVGREESCRCSLLLPTISLTPTPSARGEEEA